MTARRMLLTTARTTRIVISATVRSPDIRALALAAGWDGAGQIECVINAGVDVAALSITTLPHDLLHVINNGRIGGVVNGGTGLYARSRMKLTNAGTIFGGGGRGGEGGRSWVKYRFDDEIFWTTPGQGGSGAGFSASGPVVFANQQGGDYGSYWEYSGAVAGGETAPWARGGTGGTGGGIGAQGLSGQAATYGGSYQDVGIGAPYPGAPAGYYVDGNSFVTWLATGTRLGGVA